MTSLAGSPFCLPHSFLQMKTVFLLSSRYLLNLYHMPAIVWILKTIAENLTGIIFALTSAHPNKHTRNEISKKAKVRHVGLGAQRKNTVVKEARKC